MPKTIECIKHLNSLGTYRFNLTFEEKASFVLDEHVGSDELIAFLSGLDGELVWGEFYAFAESTAENPHFNNSGFQHFMTQNSSLIPPYFYEKFSDEIESVFHAAYTMGWNDCKKETQHLMESELEQFILNLLNKMSKKN